MSRRLTSVLLCGVVLGTLVGCGSDGAATATSATAAAATGASVTASSATSSAMTSSSMSSGASSTGTAAASSAPTAQQVQYCTAKGGQVQTRQPYWGTNADQASWVPLAGSATMCRFQSGDEAKSRIYVDLTTLSSPQPTLAALAYRSKVPLPATTGGANPATGYCSKQLGGSSTFGGISAQGGGWVAKNDPDDVVVALCVFPDLSYIDEWGLAYHSDGSVRGTNLETAMAYQPTGPLPPVFPSGTAAAPTS